jgi:hypothetical protein
VQSGGGKVFFAILIALGLVIVVGGIFELWALATNHHPITWYVQSFNQDYTTLAVSIVYLLGMLHGALIGHFWKNVKWRTK